ncbi:hypothetical protein D3C80_1453100 [compost metagenome]
MTEVDQLLVVVQFTSELQTSGPSEDRCDRVSRRRVTFLVLTIVTGYGTVCRFSFHGFSIRSNQCRSHQTQRTETLSYGIRLNVTVVVFTSPYKVTVPFQCRSNHVIDQAMLISNTRSFKLSFEFILIDLFKNIFETTIVFFKDSIFSRQVQRPFFA